MARSFLVFICLIWANLAVAQTYPSYQSTTVNDYADLLSPTDETELSSRLARVRQELGVEMTVLTLDTRVTYAPNQTLEQFATNLFNHWGIGNATRDDGVLVMVLRNDRAMRVELGASYGRQWDKVAQDIVNSQFLPAFQSNDYASGILNGSAAVIEQIVTPHSAGKPAPTRSPIAGPVPWIFGGFLAFIGLMKGRGAIGDQMARLRSCPNCGQRSLRQNRSTITPATTSMSGSGMRRVRCSNCDYQQEFPYIIAQISKGSSGRFGGGSSGGGGASGRW